MARVFRPTLARVKSVRVLRYMASLLQVFACIVWMLPISVVASRRDRRASSSLDRLERRSGRAQASLRGHP